MRMLYLHYFIRWELGMYQKGFFESYFVSYHDFQNESLKEMLGVVGELVKDCLMYVWRCRMV